MRNRASQFIFARAFTLLELLLAVVVFAIVLAAINTIFYGAVHLRNKTTSAIESSVGLEQALVTIKRDLGSLVTPGGTMLGELQTSAVNASRTAATQGAQAGPVFYCASGLIDENSPWADIQKVSYSVVTSPDRDAGNDLYRIVTRNLLPNVQEDSTSELLLNGVQAIDFLFYDGTQWRSSWDSTTDDPKLPKAIKALVTLAPDINQRKAPPAIELVVPVMVLGRTNQTNSASSAGGQG